MHDDLAQEFEELAGRLPAGEAVGALAAAHADDVVPLMEALRGSHALARVRAAEPKTIGVFYSGLGTGGAERVTRDQMVLWRQMGYRVVFLHNDDAPVQGNFGLPEGVTDVALPSCFSSTGERYLARGRALDEALAAHDIDVLVYGQWLSPTLPWDLLVARLRGVAFVVHAHGTFAVIAGYDYPEFARLPFAYEHASGVVCLSAADCAFWRAFCPHVWRSNNAIDARYLEQPAAELSGHTIVWVGRVQVDKNPLAMLDVLAAVRAQVGDARLRVVGPVLPGVEGPFFEHARELGVLDALEVCGDTPEDAMPQVYREADVMLMTSRYEGYPGVLAEAKAAGVPCVMYDLPYLTLVEGGPAVGVLSAPVDDVAGLARQVARVLADGGLRRELGAAARAHMRELARFDARALWADVFATACRGKAASGEGATGEGRESRLMWRTLLSTVGSRVRELKGARASLAACESELGRARTREEELRRLLAEAQGRADGLARELADVRGSASFRAGRALTAPLRKLRDAVMKRG